LSKNVILFGKTGNKRQRFKCSACQKTFIWKRPYNKIYKEKHWFDLWIKEGYSVRQLSYISGHSKHKLRLVVNYWLNKEPPALLYKNYQAIKYILFDGTYFHKNGCLAIFMDYITKNIVHYAYISKESYHNVYPLCLKLKEQGVNPLAVSLDGHRLVIKAIIDVWPDIIIQRCLYHILNQGLMWIRTHPKTKAGKELRVLLKMLTSIKNNADKQAFLTLYARWFDEYSQFY